jgi:hypothetical protein
MLVSVAVVVSRTALASNGSGQTHFPPLHVMVPGQTFPHAPQLDLSVPVFTQTSLQIFCCVSLHVHPPPEQCEFAGQAWSQTPQCLSLDSVSMQLSTLVQYFCP